MNAERPGGRFHILKWTVSVGVDFSKNAGWHYAVGFEGKFDHKSFRKDFEKNHGPGLRRPDVIPGDIPGKVEIHNINLRNDFWSKVPANLRLILLISALSGFFRHQVGISENGNK